MHVPRFYTKVSWTQVSVEQKCVDLTFYADDVVISVAKGFSETGENFNNHCFFVFLM